MPDNLPFRPSLLLKKVPILQLDTALNIMKLDIIFSSYLKFQETVLLDGITELLNIKIECPDNWGNIKTVKGISICVITIKKL